MTAFTVCRVAKLTTPGNIGGSGAHIHRTRPTPSADAKRQKLNRVLVGLATDHLPTVVEARIKRDGSKTRKNSVPAFEMLLSASPEFFRPKAPEKAGAWNEARLEAWVKCSEKWLKDKYGDKLVSAVLHLDEATPHIHAVIVPIDDKNSLNCRAFLGGRKLLQDLQTDAAKAVEHLGIERGIERSLAKHTEIQKYYGFVNSPFETLPPILTAAPAALRPEPEAPGFFSGPAKRKAYAEDLKKFEEEKKRNAAILAKRNEEIRALNAKARGLVEKSQAQARDSKMKDRDMKALKTANSGLSKQLAAERAETAALRALAAELRGADLVDVLQRVYNAKEDEGSKPSHKTRKFRLPDRSGSIAVTGELWTDNTADVGGKGALNLVMQIEGWDQSRFKDAVRVLAEHFQPGQIHAAVGRLAAVRAVEDLPAIVAEPRPPVDLLHVPSTWPRVERYLNKTRMLPMNLIAWARERGLVQSDDRANCVFVLPDRQGCFRRGSNDPKDRPAFKQTQRPTGSRLPFVVPGRPGGGGDVWTCEAPIDALTIKSIFPGAAVVATGGNTDPLKLAAIIREQLAANGPRARLVMAQDDDGPGEDQATRMKKALGPLARHAIRARPPGGAEDWNEALKRRPTMPMMGLLLTDDGRALTPADIEAEARAEREALARAEAEALQQAARDAHRPR